MAPYKLTPAAKEDLKEIWNYSEERWGVTQADKYLKALEKCIEDLAKFPEKGRLRNEIRRGYRSFPEGQHLVFYKAQKKQIEVVRILHKKMDVKSQFEE